jgi:hypothetical protein
VDKMSQVTIPTCADCFHPKENHPGDGHFCNKELDCMCQKYIEPFLYEFAQRVEQEKHERKSIGKRCEYILEKIPQSRNAGEKTFYKIYIEIWHGFKIRKGNPQVMDSDWWKRLPNQDTVNREKRRCKQWNEDLKTYDSKVVWEQTAIYQALLEMSAE